MYVIATGYIDAGPTHLRGPLLPVEVAGVYEEVAVLARLSPFTSIGVLWICHLRLRGRYPLKGVF